MKMFSSLSGAGMFLALAVFGCASHHEEGVKSDYRTQWTDVAADTKATTAAARVVLESSELKDVTASSTGVDGSVTGRKADGTRVNVAIAKRGDGSKVSVTVGTLGNPSLGASYARQIKERAESSSPSR